MYAEHDGWTDGVVGKSSDSVWPTTYAEPSASTAMPDAKSAMLPPSTWNRRARDRRRAVVRDRRTPSERQSSGRLSARNRHGSPSAFRPPPDRSPGLRSRIAPSPVSRTAAPSSSRRTFRAPSNVRAMSLGSPRDPRQNQTRAAAGSRSRSDSHQDKHSRTSPSHSAARAPANAACRSRRSSCSLPITHRAPRGAVTDSHPTSFIRSSVEDARSANLRRARTASVDVRNSVYPGPRDTNFTSPSVWPRFASNPRGSLP